LTRDKIIVDYDDKILVTGANGFIGTRLVKILLEFGFTNICCFVRPTGEMKSLAKILKSYPSTDIKVIKGNLLSYEDCIKATKGISIVYHLAAGVEKTFPGCFMNSVITTRNLLDAVKNGNCIKRFLNVSSFAVYSPSKLKKGSIFTETCEVENKPHLRGDGYSYGKVKQEELLFEYGKKYNIPFVVVRPGVVYGLGKNAISGRIGIDTFGIFMHMGGFNQIPLTYVDNCSEAIALAGIITNLEGEVFNIVDDDPPTSHEFLSKYKKNVRKLSSIRIHYRLSQLLCILWEKYSRWSKGQLPPAFNRKRWAAEWRGYRYDNSKLKKFTGWQPRVATEDGLARFFQFAKESGKL